MAKSKLWVWLFDLHYPKVDRPTFRAMMQFLKHNKLDGFGFGGDQFDNESISPHTRGKHRKIALGSIKNDELRFDNEVLRPIEMAVGRGCEKVWIEGNHCHWIEQYIDEHPELEGKIERPLSLGLKGRGWQVIECGHSFKRGRLRVIHGEAIVGGANCAKKALEQYCGSVLFGHFHALQVATKVMPHDMKKKWAAYCSPIMGNVNASYLRNKPTAWGNGFTIVEILPNGNFNVYPVIVSNGTFAFGGRIYQG
jgi:hypothetical protein